MFGLRRKMKSKLSKDCYCKEWIFVCPECRGRKIVYAIDFTKKRVVEAILLGIDNQTGLAWTKVDNGKYNEVHEIYCDNLYESEDAAIRGMFKHKLKGTFRKK